MSEQRKISVGLAALVAYNGAGTFGQGALRERERYERLMIMAHICGIRSEDVDAKLAVSTYQETHDWITGAEPPREGWPHDLADVLSRMLASERSL